ncbi:hypothetical protein ACQKK5_17200 [Brevibacillus panacihumi]|uniref:hypothetical protein n=1 Tax=Brevibacillus panacihumi TaxID=497735 RepID=UPI003CFDD0BF
MMAQGLAKKIVFLLIANVPPMLFLLAPQIAYDYGVVGIVGFTAAGMLSFLFTRLMYQRTREQEGGGLQTAMLFFSIAQFGCYLLLTAKIIILRTYLNDSVWYLLALAGVITAIILLASRRGYGRWIPVSVIMMGMIASVIIPTLVYLHVSIPTVYSGVHFLSIDTLSANRAEMWWVMAVFFMGMMAQQLLPVFFGNGKQKGLSQQAYPHTLSAFLWSCLPISLGSLAFVAKAQAIWPKQTDQVGVFVIEQFGGEVGHTLFLVSILSMLIYSLASTVKKVRKSVLGARGLIGGLLLAVSISLWPDITMLDVFVGFCLVWGPLLSVITVGTKSKANLLFFFTGSVTAVVVSLQTGMIPGILWGSLLSTILAFAYKFMGKKTEQSASEAT